MKPLRHVTGVHELDTGESAELGPLMTRVTAAVRAEAGDECEQVYVCLWSHAGRVPGHIHFVVQPARTSDIDRHGGVYGPALQAAMFAEDAEPDPGAVEDFCVRVRRALNEHAPDGDSAI
ncbi:hypothetical protein ACWFRJ_18220 [Streptomyces sp. NPDC055239]